MGRIDSNSAKVVIKDNNYSVSEFLLLMKIYLWREISYEIEKVRI